jgi:hypothetical protein
MAKIEKQGVAWNRKFSNGKEGIKISLNKEIYIAYKNTQKKKETDPDYVIIRFVDDDLDSK